LSGAEIDAARRGWSFDLSTSAALALATAVLRGDEALLKAHRARAARAGISQDARREIEAVVNRSAGRRRGRE
jgi:alkylhydroperoxidase/carboxymuconolactone decarboxylase family protein YurZ